MSPLIEKASVHCVTMLHFFRRYGSDLIDEIVRQKGCVFLINRLAAMSQ